ncbi:MAG: alpha/beta hydrolase family protein [Thermomicrobiales bacterium]|jgi:predicted alpha/beta-hydrolase family hydrolase|nr:alpha/beta fold hydrolase [Thermomicrobiales bacterium]
MAATAATRFALTNRQGQRIVGLIDYPAGDGPVTRTLVLCHGYGGDKDGAYLRQIAATLTAAGSATVRFDFTNGAGESDGDLRGASVAGYAGDLEDVLDYVRTQPRLCAGAIAIGGHSYAGMVVLVVAARRADVAAVFFLSAVFSRTREFDMLDIARRVRVPIIVIHGAADREVALTEPEQLRQIAGSRVVETIIVPDADHNYLVPGTALLVATAIRDALLKYVPLTNQTA